MGEGDGGGMERGGTNGGGMDGGIDGGEMERGGTDGGGGVTRREGPGPDCCLLHCSYHILLMCPCHHILMVFVWVICHSVVFMVGGRCVHPFLCVGIHSYSLLWVVIFFVWGSWVGVGIGHLSAGCSGVAIVVWLLSCVIVWSIHSLVAMSLSVMWHLE